VTGVLTRPEGTVRSAEVSLKLPINPNSLDQTSDVGSKQWLLSQALRNESNNPYMDDRIKPTQDSTTTTTTKSTGDTSTKSIDEDESPEDRFHINLPKGAERHVGAVTSDLTHIVADDEELPEDRFHRADAGSAFHISQREQGIKDKWDKHEKDKEERQNDPNVEYIDIEDFKKGGKYGPSKEDGGRERVEELQEVTPSDELRMASNVVASTVGQKLTSSVELSSSMWTELLD
jgi:hypothetical protein